MKIEKLAKNPNAFKRRYFYYSNARSAFRSYMEALGIERGDRILLPAYIGWSSREGSGVFDPVAAMGLSAVFYRLESDLSIDVTYFENLLTYGGFKLLVVIHYFGFVDPFYEEVVRMAHARGMKVIEDEAHALFTDMVGGISGHLGDAAIFSLHKMLPRDRGGILCINSSEGIVDLAQFGNEEWRDCFEYDFARIANSRIENAKTLAIALKDRIKGVASFHPILKPGEVPQTYPVWISGVSRNRLYEKMNHAGFGVVSLYHTMIEQLSRVDFPISFDISRHIMNLPVHQDANPQDMLNLVDVLADTVGTLITEDKKIDG